LKVRLNLRPPVQAVDLCCSLGARQQRRPFKSDLRGAAAMKVVNRGEIARYHIDLVDRDARIRLSFRTLPVLRPVLSRGRVLLLRAQASATCQYGSENPGSLHFVVSSWGRLRTLLCVTSLGCLLKRQKMAGPPQSDVTPVCISPG